MTMAAPEQLAAWAVSFDGKLRGLVDDLDASWQDELLGPWAFLEALPPESAASLWPRLWRDRMAPEGGLPALGRFADPLPRLGLLPRGELLQRLCIAGAGPSSGRAALLHRPHGARAAATGAR